MPKIVLKKTQWRVISLYDYIVLKTSQWMSPTSFVINEPIYDTSCQNKKNKNKIQFYYPQDEKTTLKVNKTLQLLY